MQGMAIYMGETTIPLGHGFQKTFAAMIDKNG